MAGVGGCDYCSYSGSVTPCRRYVCSLPGSAETLSFDCEGETGAWTLQILPHCSKDLCKAMCALRSSRESLHRMCQWLPWVGVTMYSRAQMRAQ